ncbi:carbohydrate ABC transporter permease [Anaerosporobacter sp.]|uniref:carbohydrate ABC transporter permease n=1 Tax=Anaerosporobacter sp. TaxID=1872529 RepID=UPI00286ED71D|nr:carbohydrate ABC transporter permease [Anaerosporobacter sp.]
MRNKKGFSHKKHIFAYIILILSGLLIWIPIYMVISGCLMRGEELTEYIGVVLNKGEGYVTWPVVPLYPTLQSIVELLFDAPQFFVMFWNSCKQVLPAIFGQCFVAIPAAWSFARYRFPCKNILFYIYVVLMILPFQVTIVSSYLVLNKIHVLNTHLAIILPAIFSTFPVFIMTKFFKGIPEEMLEAARLDGAGEGYIFFHIGIPLGNAGIISALVLSFVELWNCIEQPLTFLRDKSYWPLSLYLPQISTDKVGVSFVASFIMMLPALLLFINGQEYLEQGIVASGIKQ